MLPEWSFVDFTSSVLTSGDSFVIDVPSGVEDGDFLVLAVTDTSNLVNFYSAAWSNSLGGQFSYAYRVADSEPASYTFTTTHSSSAVVVMYAVRSSTGLVLVNSGGSGGNIAGTTIAPVDSLVGQQVGDLVISGFQSIDGGTMTLPSPNSFLTGSSTEDVTADSLNLGVISSLSIAPGNATLASSATAMGNFGFVLRGATTPTLSTSLDSVLVQDGELIIPVVEFNPNLSPFLPGSFLMAQATCYLSSSGGSPDPTAQITLFFENGDPFLDIPFDTVVNFTAFVNYVDDANANVIASVSSSAGIDSISYSVSQDSPTIMIETLASNAITTVSTGIIRQLA